MKIVLTGIASLVCICLLSQAASGFEPKISSSLVVLSDCDAGYLVKDCSNSKTIKRTKGYVINLKESLTVDSSDKKKDIKTKEKKPDTKKLKDKDLKKKFEKIKEKSKKKKTQPTQKTKHDTAKNSIGNIR